LGDSSQLHGDKGLDGFTFHNANTQKGNINNKISVKCHFNVRFFNMFTRAGIRTGRDK